MHKTSLSRKELYNLVWSESITSLAKKYSTTFDELRKLCKEQQIPIPPNGYWMKLKHGKIVNIEPLREFISTTEKSETQEQLIVVNQGNKITPLIVRQKEIEIDPSISVIVPSKLTKPHILIAQARETILNPPDYRISNKNSSGFSPWEVLKIEASTTYNLDRAFKFMDTLIKALLSRGHETKIVGSDTCIFLYGEKFKVNCREKYKRVYIEGKYGRESNLVPTGILTFNIEGYHSKEWKDGKQKLEEQVSTIIAKLELDGERKREETIQHKKYWAEQEEIKRIKQLQEELKKKEEQNFQALLNSAVKYREATILKEYIDAVEAKTISECELTEAMKKWIKWARTKLDSYNPVLISDVSILELQKESLSNNV